MLKTVSFLSVETKMELPDSSLSELLECTICCDVFDQPKIAGPCGHTFCQGCLEGHVRASARGGTFSCPNCRRQCTLPSNGVEGLGTNYAARDVIEREKRRPKDVTSKAQGGRQVPCDVCREDTGSNVPASLSCPTCVGMTLCEECGRKHPGTMNFLVSVTHMGNH